jgi:hypothetical protein
MNAPTKIEGKDRYATGVLKYAQMGYWTTSAKTWSFSSAAAPSATPWASRPAPWPTA